MLVRPLTVVCRAFAQNVSGVKVIDHDRFLTIVKEEWEHQDPISDSGDFEFDLPVEACVFVSSGIGNAEPVTPDRYHQSQDKSLKRSEALPCLGVRVRILREDSPVGKRYVLTGVMVEHVASFIGYPHATAVVTDPPIAEVLVEETFKPTPLQEQHEDPTLLLLQNAALTSRGEHLQRIQRTAWYTFVGYVGATVFSILVALALAALLSLAFLFAIPLFVLQGVRECSKQLHKIKKARMEFSQFCETHPEIEALLHKT